MQTLNHIPPVPGNLPSGYGEVLYWKISDKLSRILFMNLLSIPLFVFAGGIFMGLAVSLGRMSDSVSSSTPANGLVFLVALPLTLVLHELIHGMSMQIFGAHPKYGFLWKALAFYATSPGFAFPRRQYLIIAVAPLILLSLVAVLLIGLLSGTAWVFVIAFAATLNAAGAIGDLWISAVVLRFPAHAYVVDERDGMRIFLPD